LRKWKNPSGKTVIGALPDKIEQQLRSRTANVLERHGHTEDLVTRIVQEIVDVVSYAYVGRQFQFEKQGRGRPPSVSGNVLSVDVIRIFKDVGVRGNWLAPGDDQEDGVPGPVAEIEAIAQTAYKEACGLEGGILARPARISEAGKKLGKVTREVMEPVGTVPAVQPVEDATQSWRAWRWRFKVIGWLRNRILRTHQRFTPRSPPSQAPSGE
jgi:hypothetical protein